MSRTGNKKKALTERRLKLYIIGLGAFLFVAAIGFIVVLFPLQLAGRPVIKIGGGSPILSISPVVNAMKHVLDDEFDIQIVASKGAAQNLTMLCQGNIDMGLIHGHLEAPCERGQIRAIAGMFKSTLHVIVKSDSAITKIQDIAGSTKVAVGPEGSGTEVLARKILGFYRLKPMIEIVDSFEDERKALEEGRVQVAFVCASIPMMFFWDIEQKAVLNKVQLDKYRLIGIPHADGLVRNFPALQADVIDKGVYSGQLPEEDIKTVAVPTLLVVSPKYGAKSGSQAAISRILQLMYESGDETLRKHAHLMYQDRHFSENTSLYPLHPGALRFFEKMPPRSVGEIASQVVLWITAVAGLVTIIVGLYQLKQLKQRPDAAKKASHALKPVSNHISPKVASPS